MRVYSILTALTLLGLARSAEICCPDIGCFTDDPPYNGQPLPMCLESMDPMPEYVLYTRSNRLIGQVFDKNTVPPNFNSSVYTVFVAHGWQNSGSTPWVPDMKNAFLDKDDCNVVVADWRGGAEQLLYPQSAANTRTVGAETALVMNNLMVNGGTSNALLWCVGHSLGSHMCGHAGMKSNPKIARITGMDPAGPWFEIQDDRTVGLNPTSAFFVDVIHTDSVLGTTRDVGHIDFYPNGGVDQPGCNGDTCDHLRAHEYMQQSIIADCFLSRQNCTDYNVLPGSCSTCTCGVNPCAIMGYNAPSGCRISGIFYLDVSDTVPHCVG